MAWRELRGSVWERIESVKNTATKTEKALIEAVRRINPKTLVYMSVTELADISEVAEATIVRFCRKIDLRAFRILS
ncbi:MAG: hypothetical protein LBS99_07515 [Clostridiales bacterium]|jgi:DNA-binding MurR/RpiR family transcriptional regulator|nr:hypothetical protein [Clostridiales bacterium]